MKPIIMEPEIKNFTIKKNKRKIILGDSLSRRMGIDYKGMLQIKLERNLNFEFYNFGTGGDFDPFNTILYTKFSKKFHHDEIFIL